MNKVKSYKQQKQMLLVFAIIAMVVQILLVVLILFLSLHAFLLSLNNHMFDFMNPVVAFAKDFVKFFFGNIIKASRPEIDGELVAFIFVTAFVVFVVAQLKIAAKITCDKLDKKIVEEKRIEEERINKELQRELQKDISSNSSFMLAFAFKAVPLIVDSMQIYGEKPIDAEKYETEVRAKLIAAFKTITGVMVSKSNDTLILVCHDFNKIDSVLTSVQGIVQGLKKEYRTQKVVLKVRYAIDCFKPSAPAGTIFKGLVPLLGLNKPNEILCYGNFNNRYKLIKEPQYTIYVNGQYEFNGKEETVWALVKKR